jgi:DNA-binding winged helix-turn-helix (wHTH) protein
VASPAPHAVRDVARAPERKPHSPPQAILPVCPRIRPETVVTDEYRFAEFAFFPERQLLTRKGATVRVGSRALAILHLLVERHESLVTKRDILAHVWPALEVGEENIRINIVALRRALGDDQAEHRFIVTDQGRGYRFVAPELVELALAQAQRSAGTWFNPELLRIRACALAAQGAAVETVESSFAAALATAGQQRAAYWELRAAFSLAQYLSSLQRPAEAHAVLRPVYDKFTQGFDLAELRATRELLSQLP